MLYSELAKLYEELESTTKKLKKRDLIAEFLKKTPADRLPMITLLVMGRVFPPYAEEELGIADKLMQQIIAVATGANKKEVLDSYRKTGDLGLVAEHFTRHRRQMALLRRELTVEKVFSNLSKLPSVTGSGSQEEKQSLIVELLAAANPLGARYVVRTVLGQLRIGVAEGVIRDAIAVACKVPANKVEDAYNMLTDYGEVAKIARLDGTKGLERVKIVIGKPIRCMLAEKAPDLRTAMEEYENVQLEVKVDGFRAQIHKQEEKIKIFSRRLEDVTTQFPELVELSRICLSAKSCIVDGEIQAIDEKGAPRPFQELSERIHRKYDIAEMVKKIPVQINIFDAIYSDGKNLMSEPLHKRWGELERIVKQRHGFVLIDKLITKDYSEAEKFYKKALSAGHEGIIVKNLDAVYQPGKRVGYWLKVKPIMEPLDLVIIGAEWGRGKRAGWLSSIVLAARDPETGEFLPTGMLGTGLTDEQFAELTKRLKPLIISEKGREVKIKPTVVVEIGYEEIQRSPKYPTGYALRFPRLLRFRDDKSIEEIDTKGRIEHLFKMQK